MLLILSILKLYYFVTHADESCGSKAFICVHAVYVAVFVRTIEPKHHPTRVHVYNHQTCHRDSPS